MPHWLLERLFDHQDQPTPQFAFQGTVNWMRALAILVETEKFSVESLRAQYAQQQRRQVNVQGDTLAYESMLMSMHNVACLSALHHQQDVHYEVVRASIIAWYYAMYYACKAMLAAASASDPQTHSKTARVWQSDIVNHGLAVEPFSYSLQDLTPQAVDMKIRALRGHNPYDLNTRPANLEQAQGAVISYLKGTAEYQREEIEAEVRNSKEFKQLRVDNFRTRAARELRDRSLSNGLVNFMVQAFRYRGKANYRDSIYLSYGDDKSAYVSTFISDMAIVATKFSTMACHYISRRTERGTWQSFITDIEANARFEVTINLNEI